MAEIVGTITNLSDFLSKTQVCLSVKPNDPQQQIICLEADRKYSIPAFQREVRWDDNNLKMLLYDLSRSSKFLGNIILTIKSDHTCEIIDGQQRTTVLVSSVTTLDIYSHITDTMQRQAAVHIDRKIGGTDAQMPTIAREERKDTSPVEFTPYKPKIRKPGTGCVTMINDHLYEGRYTPTNAYGKRESHNIYAKTREECEEKLAEMIAEVKAQIKAEKEKMTG